MHCDVGLGDLQDKVLTDDEALRLIILIPLLFKEANESTWTKSHSHCMLTVAGKRLRSGMTSSRDSSNSSTILL